MGKHAQRSLGSLPMRWERNIIRSVSKAYLREFLRELRLARKIPAEVRDELGLAYKLLLWHGCDEVRG